MKPSLCITNIFSSTYSKYDNFWDEDRSLTSGMEFLHAWESSDFDRQSFIKFREQSYGVTGSVNPQAQKEVLRLKQ